MYLPGQESYRAAAESARRAVLKAVPFKLPPGDQEKWGQDIILNFDPRQMLGGCQNGGTYDATVEPAGDGGTGTACGRRRRILRLRGCRHRHHARPFQGGDRKIGVEGKSVSVRLD